jgi:hypothetical protein
MLEQISQWESPANKLGLLYISLIPERRRHLFVREPQLRRPYGEFMVTIYHVGDVVEIRV